MKILISSRSFGKIDSGAKKILEDSGLQILINPYGRKLNEEEMIEFSNDVVGIIAGTEKITKKIIESANKLKVISRYGIGMDNIDLRYAKKHGIIVRNTPDAPTQAVAELTFSLILNLLRKICQVNKNVKSKNWKPEFGSLLENKTLGIIGLGRIGKKLSELVQPFNVNISTYDIYPDKKFISKYKIKLISFEKLLSKSDIISLHLPINEKTRNIIGKKELSLMKKNSIIINTARGGLIDENALSNALNKKLIAGVAIDAFEKEPYEGQLINYDNVNVILTPHIGSYTIETRKKMEIEAVTNLIDELKKENMI